MTAKEPLSLDELKRVEVSIAAGQLDVMYELALDGIIYHASDISELNRRKEILLNANHEGNTRVLWYIGILAVMTDDKKVWSFVRKFLGDLTHPALGYRAYHQKMRQTEHEQDLKDWFFLVEDSASLGHLHAKRLSFEAKVSRFGFVKLPLMALYRVWFTLVGALIVTKDPEDLRLPLEVRRHQN